ncbi:MAG: hypothetical protein JXA77_18535 [Bacteroidales bacterium]|nr:hypothetical protein [Bacteroidales bacterium]MBN2818184.1 hypothetical protein [Bacteroidales bacterium]
MIAVKTTGDGCYLVSMNGNVEDLGHNECQMLMDGVMSFLRPHKDIAINLEGVKAIDDKGFFVLSELMMVAKKSRCYIQFFNIEPNLLNKIAGLTQKMNFTQREVE